MPDFPDLHDEPSRIDDRSRVIVFEDLDLALRIGAFEAERHGPQRVRISIEILVRPPHPHTGDRLEDVLGYHQIHDAILGLAERPHVDLQETLAEDVARICLAPAEVVAVRVYVRKLDVYAHCRSVGIRIVRSKPGVG
jgi:7,8-dihydroneopterin aldolase/epimerase/oxygenase